MTSLGGPDFVLNGVGTHLSQDDSHDLLISASIAFDDGPSSSPATDPTAADLGSLIRRKTSLKGRELSLSHREALLNRRETMIDAREAAFSAF